MRNFLKSERFKVVTLPWLGTLLLYGFCFPPVATGWIFYVKDVSFLVAVGQIYMIGVPLAFCMGALTMAFVWKNKRDTVWEALSACGAVFMVALAWLIFLMFQDQTGVELRPELSNFVLTFVFATLIALICWRCSRLFRRSWVEQLQKERPAPPAAKP